MSGTRPRVWLGARGWLHDGWLGVYYPPDLPPEWRLEYYLHDFGALWIRPAELLSLDDEQRQALAGLPSGRFRLLLELADPPARDAGLRLCRDLGVALSGLVAGGEEPWRWLPGLPRPGESDDPAAWHPVCDGETPAADADCHLLRLAGRADLRHRRRQIEAVLPHCRQELWLLLDGPSPSCSQLQELATLVGLLGGDVQT